MRAGGRGRQRGSDWDDEDLENNLEGDNPGASLEHDRDNRDNRDGEGVRATGIRSPGMHVGGVRDIPRLLPQHPSSVRGVRGAACSFAGSSQHSPRRRMSVMSDPGPLKRPTSDRKREGVRDGVNGSARVRDGVDGRARQARARAIGRAGSGSHGVVESSKSSRGDRNRDCSETEKPAGEEKRFYDVPPAKKDLGVEVGGDGGDGDRVSMHSMGGGVEEEAGEEVSFYDVPPARTNR